MKRIAVAVVAVVLLVVSASPGRAQQPTPTPIPHSVTLVEQAPGSYRLDIRNAATALGRYEVGAFVSRIGSDQGVVVALAESDRDDFSFVLPARLEGMGEEACYHVSLFVQPADRFKAQPENLGAGIETKACVDSAGVITFPAFDSVIEPPPPPPSDVRVVRVPGSEYPDAGGDTWRVDWTDNSDAEIAFFVRIILLDRPWDDGGSQISFFDLPEVPTDQTSIGSIGFFFTPDGPPEPVCGSALVLVFAVGGDSPSIWPGNTTVPACFGYGTISFPATGGGSARRAHDAPLEVIAIAVCLGAVLIAAGVRVRRFVR